MHGYPRFSSHWKPCPKTPIHQSDFLKNSSQTIKFSKTEKYCAIPTGQIFCRTDVPRLTRSHRFWPRPSNMKLHRISSYMGKPGPERPHAQDMSGGELEQASGQMGTVCRVVHLNCEVIDTQYRVIAQISKYILGARRHQATR